MALMCKHSYYQYILLLSNSFEPVTAIRVINIMDVLRKRLPCTMLGRATLGQLVAPREKLYDIIAQVFTLQ